MQCVPTQKALFLAHATLVLKVKALTAQTSMSVNQVPITAIKMQCVPTQKDPFLAHATLVLRVMVMSALTLMNVVFWTMAGARRKVCASMLTAVASASQIHRMTAS